LLIICAEAARSCARASCAVCQAFDAGFSIEKCSRHAGHTVCFGGVQRPDFAGAQLASCVVEKIGCEAGSAEGGTDAACAARGTCQTFAS
jgi:hypothetical protein